jgi:HPt (histidine-containing phosphotransfer) domain-containing protein
MDDSNPVQSARDDVIDRAQLASLRQIQNPGESDFVTELIDLFLIEAHANLDALRQAVSAGDAPEIKRLAHRLRGCSANMGATRFAELAEQLEKEGSPENEQDRMLELEEEYALVREALNAERKEINE